MEIGLSLSLTSNKGVGAPSGYVILRDLDGSPLNDLDGQLLYEAA